MHQENSAPETEETFYALEGPRGSSILNTKTHTPESAQAASSSDSTDVGVIMAEVMMALVPTISGWSRNFTRTFSGNIAFEALPSALPATAPRPHRRQPQALACVFGCHY